MLETDALSLRRTALVLAAGLTVASPAGATPAGHCIRAQTPTPGRLLAQSPLGPIELGQQTRMVTLELVCAADERSWTLSQRVAAATPRRRFFLVIDDLRAEAQPGVLFDLKLSAAPDRQKPASESGALLGTLNFYAAQRPGAAARPRMVSYDVTNAVKSLAASRKVDAGLVLAIQPAKDPTPGSGATIARIALVEQ